MGAVVCDYFLNDARNQHGFFTMNKQDDQLQLYTKQNILRFYAHGQLRFEQAEVAIAWGGESQGMDGIILG
jgi:predicted DNA-binding WGR domain protein